MQFSETTNNSGIVQQVRDMCRVDATQWPTQRIVNSVNNWLDKVTGYALTADRNFQWDDTNHTKLPIGTTNLVANQKDYSFLTDEQGNKILTLTRLEAMDSSGMTTLLKPINQYDIDMSLDEYEKTAGTPKYYDMIADNIVRLYPKPSASVTNGLKFYFQRVPSYFAATDTTKEPGVAPIIHRGAVIYAAYDCALSLGLAVMQPLSVEVQKEDMKVETYFGGRNNYMTRRLTPANQDNR